MRIMRKKYLEHIRFVSRDDHDWEFEFPRVGEHELEELEEGIEYLERLPRQAERIFQGLLGRVPEFIDARHHLALLYYRTGIVRGHESRLLWEEIAETLFAVIPPEFQIGRDRIPWSHLDNRPYLRGLHSLACSYLDGRDFLRAQACLEDALLLNPDDNQGCRAMLPGCYFERRRAPAVLELAERYRGDGMSDLLWARILASYQLGNLDDARILLQEVAKHQPRIFEIISKGKKPTGNREFGRYIELGSAAEAKEYWFRNAPYWLGTPGAVAFVRSLGVSLPPGNS